MTGAADHRVLLVAAVATAVAVACSPANDGAKKDAELNAAKRRAALQIGAREYADAVRTLEALNAKAPKDEQAYVMLGDAYRGLGDFTAAVKNYEQAIRLNYGSHAAHLKLGTLLMENGKTGRALTEFEVALTFGADDALVHYNYGLALHELARRDEALAQWRIACDMDPDNARFAAALGIGLTGVDDEAAVKSFARAESLGITGDAGFCNNYALALERVGEDERAEGYFVQALAILQAESDADSATTPWARATRAAKQNEYRRNLARHYLRGGQNEDAAREFETLVAHDGGKWSDTVYLARALVATSRFGDAIERLGPFVEGLESGRVTRTDPRVDRMPPTLGEALATVGMAWRGRGDRERAREYLRRAAAQAPDDPSVLNNYGVVLAESGMLPDAKAQWRRVLEIDPENATAKANLSAFGQ